MEGVTRYPLAWPAGWARARFRESAKFGKKAAGDHKRSLTVDDAISRLTAELDRLRATDAVLSTNLAVRLDGRLRQDQAAPSDPGVAVYFRLKNRDQCFACDRWTRVADNIAAIAAHVEALRAIERYGVGTIEQAFAGYTALPPAADAWWLVLQVPQTSSLAEAEQAYRRHLAKVHPDRPGGNENEAMRLGEAIANARKVLR